MGCIEFSEGALKLFCCYTICLFWDFFTILFMRSQKTVMTHSILSSQEGLAKGILVRWTKVRSCLQISHLGVKDHIEKTLVRQFWRKSQNTRKSEKELNFFKL